MACSCRARDRWVHSVYAVCTSSISLKSISLGALISYAPVTRHWWLSRWRQLFMRSAWSFLVLGSRHAPISKSQINLKSTPIHQSEGQIQIQIEPESSQELQIDPAAIPSLVQGLWRDEAAGCVFSLTPGSLQRQKQCDTLAYGQGRKASTKLWFVHLRFCVQNMLSGRGDSWDRVRTRYVMVNLWGSECFPVWNAIVIRGYVLVVNPCSLCNAIIRWLLRFNPFSFLLPFPFVFSAEV